MIRALLAALLVALAPATAQPSTVPSGREVVEAWLADWRRAAEGVDRVEGREETAQTFDGPRRETRIEVEGRVALAPGRRTRRAPDRVRVDGRDLDPAESPRAADRWRRAFGPAGREVAAPPVLPIDLLATAGPGALRPDRWDGQDAWRVELDTRFDRAQAWFTRSPSPRLLAVRAEGRRPRGGRLSREVVYVRVDGLDVPARTSTAFTVRQRRRLRGYVVTLSAVGTYTDHVVR